MLTRRRCCGGWLILITGALLGAGTPVARPRPTPPPTPPPTRGGARTLTFVITGTTQGLDGR